MGRPKHEFLLKHVEKIRGSKDQVLKKCKYCKKTYSGSTSATRISCHLTGKEKEGISVCDKVPDHIRQEVKLQVEDRNKRQKTMPSSSNCLPEMETSVFPERQDHEVQSQSGNGIQGREQPMEEGNNFPLQTAVVEINSIDGGGMEQSLMGGGVCEGSEPEVHITEGVTMVTSTPVGTRFTDHMETLWSHLMSDRVLRIGICGMGGVGKTELAKHMNNRLLKESNSFDHVFWVDVPLEFSVTKLQSSIAEELGFSFSGVGYENKRAAKLWQALKEKGKSVLVLDNLWNYIDVERIGIPLDANGCKLVLTSRSSKFCRMTSCQEIIKMYCLDKNDEAWELFIRNLGHLSKMTSEVELVAKSIVAQCQGLPLGIITIARSMRDVNDIREWRCMLEDLKAAKPRQDINEIFESLKLSYNALDDSILQQCLLTCALHSDITNLNNLITEEINEGAESWQVEFDKAYSMVQELVSASLFEDSYASYGCIRMHSLIRIMAFKIIKEKEKVLLEFGNSQLKEVPSVERWTNELTRVVFVGTGVKSISFDNPPRCPNLAVMLLCSNWSLKFIQDSFFQHLQGLQILDLSGAAIDKLPNSVSDLLKLTTLLLRGCYTLNVIPSLAKLRRLKKLDMSYSGIGELPEGMEFLSNLTFLNLYRSEISELPNGMLANFSSLQFLGFHNFINGEELATLEKLEHLICRFNDINNFNTCTELINHCRNYRLFVGSQTPANGFAYDVSHYTEDFDSGWDRCVALRNCNLDAIYLPLNIQRLSLEYCNGRTLSLMNGSDLLDLFVCRCNEMEYLISLSSSNNVFQRLEILRLERLKMLRVLLDVQGARMPSMPPNALFSQLKKIFIYNCPSLKNLFPSALLPMLQNLEEIDVSHCQLMEEIVHVEEEGDGCPICHEVVLPKLKKLKLGGLPQLKSICNVRLVCNSLQSLPITGCDQLSRISLSLPIQSLKEVELHSRNWWRRLCSVDPNAEALLQPGCKVTWMFYLYEVICVDSSDDYSDSGSE